MLLRYCILFMLCSTYLFGAVNEDNKYYTKKILLEDATVLEQTLARKPADLVTVTRLMRIYFTVEEYQKAVHIADGYLSNHLNRDLAYLRILSLASLKKYQRASAEVDSFLQTYKMPDSDRKNLLSMQQHYLKSLEAKPFPKDMERIQALDQKLIVAILHRQNQLLICNTNYSQYYYFNFSNQTIIPAKPLPDCLDKTDLNDLLYLTIANDNREAMAVFRKNGKKVIFYKSYDAITQKWTAWNRIPELNPGNWNHYPAFLPYKGVLFASDKSTNIHFFTVHHKNNFWGSCQELTNSLTSLDDYALYLHPDEESLFYSTIGMAGQGGFDMFRTDFYSTVDRYQIAHMKSLKDINSYRNENNPLFVRAEEPVCYMNLQISKDWYVYTGKLDDDSIHPSTFLDIRVYDQNTKKPINNAVVLSALIEEREKRGIVTTITKPDGFCGFSVRKNKEYLLSVSAAGYLYYQENISVHHSGVSNYSIYLTPGEIKKGFSFTAKNIYFETGSTEINDKSYADLQNIYHFLTENPKVSIEIAGHTDNVGTQEYNIDLSQKRSEAIAMFLYGLGIDIFRLSPKGYGYTKSAASNDTDEGRQLNRRVEIIVK